MSTTHTALQSLQRDVHSISALTKWCHEHPDVLLGDLVLPPNSNVNISLRASPKQLLRHAVEDGIAYLYSKVNVSYELASPLSIDTDYVSSSSLPMVSFEVELGLRLAFSDWPLATALLTEAYIVENCAEENLIAYSDLAYCLNSHIAKHFPGWTIDRFLNLEKADLLPKPKDTKVITGYICDMLFASRTHTAYPVLPDDLTAR